MTISTESYAYEYASMILRRNRVPMPPADFAPNWADKPRPTKHYPGALSFPLPDAPPLPSATVGAGIAAAPADEPFSLPVLGAMLRDSYGLIGRRLAIQANTDVHGYPWYARANWHRGTASGGGLYPCSIYWVAGPGAELCPGVYHYACQPHTMQRLLAGDVTGRVRAALGLPTDATQFLVIGVKYWANAFKYNSFAYHAVSMDVGTLLQTWRLWAGGQRRRIEPRFWFDQAALGRLLGLPPDEEGLFAVVPLTWTASPPADPSARRHVTTAEDTALAEGTATAGTAAADGTGRAEGDVAAVGEVAVRRRDRERSRVVLTFEATQRIHRATAQVAAHRPAAGALASAAATPTPDGGDRVDLPPPSPLETPVRTALSRRRSSFGRFDGSVPMPQADLAALLTAAHAARLPTEITEAADGGLAKFYVFVNHVRGMTPGSYEYDPARHQLRVVRSTPPGLFLQRNYFLPNYNLEQAAVVVVPTVRVPAVLDAVGPRGYNVVNATIGAVAQTFYTAAAALDLGCGVALGFDGVSYVEELELAATGETPLLIMLAGHERVLPTDYRHELR
ncbi:nitroreductase family protein [Micromonospora sp. NPDC051925]|uniref:nitroreductase family protein n=1 Tax=Micromonospora sp. NPDC051925 TaxID=3364288 RepID=UPI0037CA2704